MYNLEQCKFDFGKILAKRRMPVIVLIV